MNISTSNIRTEYCEWLYRKTGSNWRSYKKLLKHLYRTEFVYLVDRDINRIQDGLSLRYRFSRDKGLDDISMYLSGPCSVLELMVALAIRCEETIMTSDQYGDRTGKWFWDMIWSLKLDKMDDQNYNREYVTERLFIFIDRLYDYNGSGGLFTVHHPNRDMRTIEIWMQLNWYLDEIIEEEEA